MWKDITTYIQEKLHDRRQSNAMRELHPNPDLIDFCSNDYLGLARSAELRKLVDNEFHSLNQQINGSTGARTITGTSRLTQYVESFLADFHRSESALLYNSGYTANLGLFSSLPYRGDTIVYDELIHASIRDGIQLSRADGYSFKHNDLESLEKKLRIAKGKKYVAIESIYSMDGDMAPLKEIAPLCEKYDAALIVDEAHSNGIFGPQGRGLVSQHELENKVFARIMTFGKALGCHGAAVIGSQDLTHFLTNYSRPFIFTTAPSSHQLLTIKNGYDIMSECNDKRLKISFLSKRLKEKLQGESSFAMIDSKSPIQCVLIPGNDRVKQVAHQVQQAGFDVRPIIAPTVPKGKERIRICIHAFNTEEEIEQLAVALQAAAQSVRNDILLT